MLEDDKSLVSATIRGDLDAFAGIVRKYSNALYSVAYSVIGDFQLAQDITQEAFIKAYSSLKKLETPDKLGSWLYAITYRHSLDWKRKATQEQRLIQQVEDMGTVHMTLEEQIEKRELQSTVWEALNQLEESNRITLILFHISGYSLKEISNFLNISVAAVDSRLRRARKLLKQELQPVIDILHEQGLDPHFDQQVHKEIIKQAGQFYIPVRNKSLARAWYTSLFGLPLDHSQNLLLPSGQTLYLLEIATELPIEVLPNEDRVESKLSSDILNTETMEYSIPTESILDTSPLLSFTVDDLQAVYQQLQMHQIHISLIQQNAQWGDYFLFNDLDGNCFSITQTK